MTEKVFQSFAQSKLTQLPVKCNIYFLKGKGLFGSDWLLKAYNRCEIESFGKDFLDISFEITDKVNQLTMERTTSQHKAIIDIKNIRKIIL